MHDRASFAGSPTRRGFLSLLAGGAAIGVTAGYVIHRETAPNGTSRRSTLNGSASTTLPRRTLYCTTLGEIYAFSADTGAVRWTRPLITSEPHTVGRSGVFAAGGFDRRVYSFDVATGAIKWIYRVSEYGNSAADLWEFPSPTVEGNIVYLAPGGGYTYAIDAVTGHLRWRQQTTRNSAGQAPVVYHGIVYVGGPDSYVYALDAITGEFRWRFGSGSQAPEAYNQGLLMVVQGKLFAGGTDRLYALDPQNGKVLGTYPPTVPCTNGVAYTGTTDGILQARDVASSRVLWTRRVENAQWSPATIADNVLYLGLSNMAPCCSGNSTDNWIGKVMALDAATGRFIWSYTAPASAFTTPVITSGIVYVAGGYNLYALSVANGDPRWIHSTSSTSFSRPVVVNLLLNIY